MAVSEVRVRSGENGRISILAAYRKPFGFEPGEELILRVQDDDVRLTNARHALARARRLVGRYTPAGKDLTQSLLADRRAEAERG